MERLMFIAMNNEFIKENVKILCFSQDSKEDDGILIFSNGLSYAKPRMWAQYANEKNNEGICLILDKSKLITNILSSFPKKNIISDNINYLTPNQFAHNVAVATALNDDILELDNLDNIRDFLINKYQKTYFFTKSIDWRDENEYRIIVLNKNNEDLFINIDGCLKAIVLGIDVDIKKIDEIKNLIEKFNNKPRLHKLELWDSYFQLVGCE